MTPSDPPATAFGSRLVAGVVLGVLVFAGLSLYADVHALVASLAAYDLRFFAAGLGLASLNYVIRFVRWQYFLARVGASVPASYSALAFVAGFVMSITPVKVGEVLKSLLLRQSHGVPIAKTAPIVLAERLTDLFAVVLLAAIGSLAFPRGRPVAIAGAAVVLLAWGLVVVRPVGDAMLRLVAKLPILRRLTPKLEEAYDSLHGLVRLGPLLVSTTLAFVAWGLECVAVRVIALGFEDGAIGGLEATFAYAAATIAGAVTMLPGGLGVTEVGMTGAFRALAPAMSQPTAVALTLLVRLATLWWAVLLGLGAYLAYPTRRAMAAAAPLDPPP